VLYPLRGSALYFAYLFGELIGFESSPGKEFS